MIRRFHFERTEDASGVSGCGRVAEGVVFTNGKVALEWLSDHSSTALYDSIQDVEHIHGHEGRTKIVFDDPAEKECKKSRRKNKKDGK
jgi:hypothetical protein